MAMRYDYDYDSGGTPAGISFLMLLLALVALCVAGIYLKASTLHRRELQISAFEENIGNWTAFRPTFNRLSVNVTAFFGVAPVNTTDPGLDAHPPPPGVSVSLAKLEEADPIFDEEGDAGGLPEYNPLKFEKGVIPPPWRTAASSPPPPAEEGSPDGEESSAENSQEGSSITVPEERTSLGGGKDGGNSHETEGDGDRRHSRHGRSRWRRRRLPFDVTDMSAQQELPGQEEDAVGEEAGTEFEMESLVTEPSRVRPTGARGAEAGRDTNGRVLSQGDALEDTQQERAPSGGAGALDDAEGQEIDEGDVAQPPLPAGFIPNVAFENATSVRFVFSARLDPAPSLSRGGNGLKKARRKKRRNGHRRLAQDRQHHQYHHDDPNQKQQQQQQHQHQHQTSGAPGGMSADVSAERGGLLVDGALWEKEMGYDEAKSTSQHSRRETVSPPKIATAAAAAATTTTTTTTATTRAIVEENGKHEANLIRFGDSSGETERVERDRANSRKTRGRSLDAAQQHGGDHSRRASSQSSGEGDDAGAMAAAAADIASAASRTRRSNRKASPSQPIFRSLETGWTPLTRIRLEHAPMPAPETKCMQVFGGVHNYKTKMCEVYERISQICVQVHVDEASGEISFAQAPQSSASGIGGGAVDGDGVGAEGKGEDGDEGNVAVARYGCDPRTAWSPWSYSVLPVEGRTVLDVVPPPSVTFAETLITLRSNLDPFLHVEAITYAPPGGGGGDTPGVSGGGDAGGDGSGGGGVMGTGQTRVSRSEGGFLTFGLSSSSCAAVGFVFLAVGLLLLLQPLFALRKWYRENAADGMSDGSRSVGRNSRRSRGSGSLRGGGGVAGRRATGQWRYGQVDTVWEDVSDMSDAQEFAGSAAYDDGELDQLDDDDWGDEGEWQQQDPVRKVSLPMQPLRSSSSLRRRLEGGAEEAEDGAVLQQHDSTMSSSNAPSHTRLQTSASPPSSSMRFGSAGKDVTFV